MDRTGTATLANQKGPNPDGAEANQSSLISDIIPGPEFAQLDEQAVSASHGLHSDTAHANETTIRETTQEWLVRNDDCKQQRTPSKGESKRAVSPLGSFHFLASDDIAQLTRRRRRTTGQAG